MKQVKVNSIILDDGFIMIVNNRPFKNQVRYLSVTNCTYNKDKSGAIKEVYTTYKNSCVLITKKPQNRFIHTLNVIGLL